MRKESGFTLIELIVVIVILGILAAFAVPRFVGMQDEARTSTVKGLKGSVHGAASLAHGKALTNSSAPDASTYTITIQGKDISFEGGSTWPEGSMDGIGNMIQDLSGFTHTTSGLNNGTIDGLANSIEFNPEGASSNSTCYVAYGVNASANNPYPLFDSDTSDCS